MIKLHLYYLQFFLAKHRRFVLTSVDTRFAFCYTGLRLYQLLEQ